MKNFKKYILLVVSMVFAISCVKDLDVTPIDENLVTSATVFDSPEAYKQALAKLYASFAVSGQQGPAGQPDIAGIDEGFSNYLRQFWNCQELTTDEAVMAWNDATIKDFHWHTWSPNDVFIAAMYSRIFFTISISNEFIRASAGSADSEVALYNVEARFIRALAYFHALDMFGNVPFVTEENDPGLYFPEQISRADLFNYVESELLEIESQLGEPRFEYGRADKAAAWTLLAKLYLNAEVYTGQERYTECINFCNQVLSSSYSLNPVYQNNFVADNNTSPEIIFPVSSDGTYTRTYGGMTYLVHASIGGNMPAADFGVGGGWGGIRTTSALVEKFEDPTGETDTRAMFWSDGQSLEIEDIAQFTNGWAITKYKNITSTGGPAPHTHPDFVDTDYPMFRLADVYLMYAEAVLRGGTGGDVSTALGYVNDLRERAYGDESGNIAQNELTLDFIIDERARELYWEGHRRTDLIRFGMFTTGNYNWPWKGNVPEGKATEAFRNLFPIPSADLTANPNLDQNDGYNF